MNLEIKNILIWGMGLLGTSLASTLKEKFSVYGCDNNIDHVKYLKEKFSVTEIKSDLFFEFLKNADLVIIATPVEAAFSVMDYINDLYEKKSIRKDLIVTDLASTKADLMDYYNNNSFYFRYAGSHPMAGSDLSGPRNAREDMFQNATIYITPPDGDSEIVEIIRDFWKQIGARPFVISHKIHDKWGAYLSHGLHLVSCMVSHLVDDISDVYNVPSNAAGGSFKDITRVAGSNPILWDGIIKSNKKEVLHYLNALKNLTEDWIQKLENSEISIREIFEHASKIREKVIKNEN